MRLTIRNLAKIDYADIRLEGITVIAGNNNTGKSTIGKSLFSIFNAVEDFESRKKEQRYEQIRRGLSQELRRKAMDYKDIDIRPMPQRLWIKYIEEITKAFDEGESIDKSLSQLVLFLLRKDEIEKDFNDNIKSQIIPILEISDEKLLKVVITKYFKSVFVEQINNIYDKNAQAEIELNENEQSLKMIFSDNSCFDYKIGFPILNKAIIIDDPFIIDRINNYISEETIINKKLLNMLRRENDDLIEVAFNELLANEKLDNILIKLNRVLDGEIIQNDNERLVYRSANSNQPIEVNNLSTGIKSFLIIKEILKNGSLKKNDIIILDEPEIHLHPEWQLVYAEIIILLQKAYDFKIVITTHSSHFLEAINYYAKRNNIINLCNYYLAECKNEKSYFKDVTNSIDEIYTEMINPSILLDKLKYELEEKNE